MGKSPVAGTASKIIAWLIGETDVHARPSVDSISAAAILECTQLTGNSKPC